MAYNYSNYSKDYNDGKNTAGSQTTEPNIELVREKFGNETAEKLDFWRDSGCMYKYAAADGEFSETAVWLTGYGDQIAQNQADKQREEWDWFLNHPSA
jgi:hypothetical protein